MNGAALRALGCAVVLTACHRSELLVDDVGLDAALIDAGNDEWFCDPTKPVGQQGCNSGQKCTWIIFADVPDPVGGIRCVPDGTVALGGTCSIGSPGERTGFDDCQAGSVCVAGQCKDVCGFGGGANEQCATGQSCTRYDGLWANGPDDPMYGACDPTCDPVTQLRAGGTSCGVGQGCFLLVSETTTTAVCAGAGHLGHGVAIDGPVFANSCLAGHQPRRARSGDTTMECGALCAVEDVFVTDPADADRGPRPAPKDATLVTNFAVEGGAAPFTCASKGAALPDDAAAGESCRYWWAREPFDQLSPSSNTVGWCFRHAAFAYDSDGNQSLDAPFPRCAAVSSADRVPPIGDPPHDDARYFWCKAMPAMLRTSIAHVKTSLVGQVLRIDRLAGWR